MAFFGHFDDLGAKHAKGMGHTKKEHKHLKKDIPLMGHLSDLGDEHPKGMGHSKREHEEMQQQAA